MAIPGKLVSDMLDMHAAGQTQAAIAAALRISQACVSKTLKRQGVNGARLGPGHITTERAQRIIDLYEGGIIQTDIAAELRLSKSAVCRFLRARGFTAPKPGAGRSTRKQKDSRVEPAWRTSIGQRKAHHYAEDIADKAVGLYAEGKTPGEIGAALERCQSWVYLVLRKRGVVARRTARTPVLARQVLDLWKTGLSTKEIAVRVGLSGRCAVSTILRAHGVHVRRRRQSPLGPAPVSTSPPAPNPQGIVVPPAAGASKTESGAVAGLVRQRPKDRAVAALDDALFEFYVSALALYSRTQALALLQHLLAKDPVRQAHEFRAAGMSAEKAAKQLETTHTTVLRWTKTPPKPWPSWVVELLAELREYSREELLHELDEMVLSHAAHCLRPMLSRLPFMQRNLLLGCASGGT